MSNEPETRVVLDYGGKLLGLVGMVKISELKPTFSRHGRTFYRAHTTPRYVLYQLALECEQPEIPSA